MSRSPAAQPLPMRPQAYRPRTRSAGPTLSVWRVFIHDLEVSASIGVHPHEHENRQRILVDVELEMTGAPFPKDDRLSETVDYEAIARGIENMAREGHVQLVETLVQRIARWTLEDKRVLKTRVRVAKPEALSNARGVGCEVEISRE